MLEAEAAPGPGLTGVGGWSEESNEEAKDHSRSLELPEGMGKH